MGDIWRLQSQRKVFVEFMRPWCQKNQVKTLNSNFVTLPVLINDIPFSMFAIGAGISTPSRVRMSQAPRRSKSNPWLRTKSPPLINAAWFVNTQESYRYLSRLKIIEEGPSLMGGGQQMREPFISSIFHAFDWKVALVPTHARKRAMMIGANKTISWSS